MTREDDNARYAEYRARERRTNIVTMAKRMFVLQIGHGGNWSKDRTDADQREFLLRKARETLAAAEAFMAEADKVLLP